MTDSAVSPLIACLAHVDDPRLERAQRHAWRDILVIGVWATICGADHRVASEDCGPAHRDGLQPLRAWPSGIPSHDTIGRVLARRDAVQLERCFGDWVQAACTLPQGPRVAIDGTRVRPAREARHGQSPLPRVRAWAQTHHLVLAPQAVADRSNEMTALPPWLRMRKREGGIGTLDRVGMPESERAPNAGPGRGLWAHRQGEPEMPAGTHGGTVGLCTVPGLCGQSLRLRAHGAQGAGPHRNAPLWGDGRPRLWPAGDPAQAWTDLQSLIKVESERRCGPQVTLHVRHFISSRAPHAPRLLAAVRDPWRIANSLHWVLEVAWREDDRGWCAPGSSTPPQGPLAAHRPPCPATGKNGPVGCRPQTPPGRRGPALSPAADGNPVPGQLKNAIALPKRAIGPTLSAAGSLVVAAVSCPCQPTHHMGIARFALYRYTDT